MNYNFNVREQRYDETDRQVYSSSASFQRMYEMAMRSSLLSGSHLGDYSKEILEKPREHYKGKMPESQSNSNLNYKPDNKFTIN